MDKQIKVDLVMAQGITFLAKGNSNHWVAMDGPEEFGGSSAGSKPMEMFMMGLAGCTGMDVVTILNKKRVNLIDFKMELLADRKEEYPQVLTKITIVYKIYGKNIKEADVKRAIELSTDKYCGAINTLKHTVEIVENYEIFEV